MRIHSCWLSMLAPGGSAAGRRCIDAPAATRRATPGARRGLSGSRVFDSVTLELFPEDAHELEVEIRGRDEHGREVRMARGYVSHGLRRRAAELATQRLGPRLKRNRLEQWKRDPSSSNARVWTPFLERRAGEAAAPRRAESGGMLSSNPL